MESSYVMFSHSAFYVFFPFVVIVTETRTEGYVFRALGLPLLDNTGKTFI